MGDTLATRAARGHETLKGHRTLICRVSNGIFQELKARALKERRSLSEKVREYVETGIAVDKDWDHERD